jgi:hypothetical protein
MGISAKKFDSKLFWSVITTLATAIILGLLLINQNRIFYWITKGDTPPSKKIILLSDKTEAYPLSASFINKEIDLLFKQLRDDQWHIDPQTGKPLDVDLTYKVLLPGIEGKPSNLIEGGFNLHPGIGNASWFIDTVKGDRAQTIQINAFKKSLKGKYEEFERDIDLANHPGGFAQESRILDEIDKVTMSSSWRDPKVETYFIIISDLLECSPRPSGIPDFETLNTEERIKAFQATGRLRPDIDPNRHRIVIFHIIKDGAPESPIVNPDEYWHWYFAKNPQARAGAIRYYPIHLNGRSSR